MTNKNIIFFKQYGLVRTGTNYIRSLLEINFNDVKVLVHQFQPKHGVPVTIGEKSIKGREDQINSDPKITELFNNPKSSEHYLSDQHTNIIKGSDINEFKYLISIKNPYSWIQSYINYTNVRSYRLLDKKDFPVRIRYGFITKNVLKDLVEFWNKSNNDYLNFLDKNPDNSFLVKYEDLIEDFSNTLENIKTKFNLESRLQKYQDEVREITAGFTKNIFHFDKDKYREEKYLETLGRKNISIINKFLDRNLMNKLGYKIVDNMDPEEDEIIENIDYCVRHAIGDNVCINRDKILDYKITGKELKLHIRDGSIEITCNSSSDTTQIKTEVFNLNLFKENIEKFKLNNTIHRPQACYELLSKIEELAKKNTHWNIDILLSLDDNPVKIKGIVSLAICSSICAPSSIPIPTLWNHETDSFQKEDCNFKSKIKMINFAGRATGFSKKDFYKTGVSNSRLSFCSWAIDFSKEINAKIHISRIFPNSNIDDWTEYDFKGFDKFTTKEMVSIQDQLKYRYLLNIDGNTTSWFRLPWQIGSNSIALYLKPLNSGLDQSPDFMSSGSTNYEWFYCLFDKFQLENKQLPLIWVDKDNILMIKEILDNDEELALSYVKAGKEFYENYLTKEKKLIYLERLLEEINKRMK